MAGLFLTRRHFSHLVLTIIGVLLLSDDRRERGNRKATRITEHQDIRTTTTGDIRITEV